MAESRLRWAAAILDRAARRGELRALPMLARLTLTLTLTLALTRELRALPMLARLHVDGLGVPASEEKVALTLSLSLTLALNLPLTVALTLSLTLALNLPLSLTLTPNLHPISNPNPNPNPGPSPSPNPNPIPTPNQAVAILQRGAQRGSAASAWALGRLHWEKRGDLPRSYQLG